jgi:hypothetical protein
MITSTFHLVITPVHLQLLAHAVINQLHYNLDFNAAMLLLMYYHFQNMDGVMMELALVGVTSKMKKQFAN